MNAWLQAMGLDHWKALISALLLPPVPWLLLIVLGALWLRRRAWLGASLVGVGVLLIWTCSTEAGADAIARWLLDPPPSLRNPTVLTRGAQPAAPTLILVLGGGRSALAEYDEVSLSGLSMERLRYGIWLSRETGYPVAFSGGIGPGSGGGPSEGAIATRIARDEFRRPLLWAEDKSRDTHENALRSMDLLRNQPPGRLVLVTHDLHMPRALGHFLRARDAAGLRFDIVPAPVGITEKGPYRLLGDYLPSPGGMTRARYAIREWLGLLARA